MPRPKAEATPHDEPRAVALAPDPPWRKPPRQPRAPITTEAIVAAALAVLDEVGLDGLSMRRVADKLSTGAASLYWHVRNKDELFQLVFDAVMEELTLPPPDPAHWKQQLRDLAKRARSVMSQHRDVGRLSLGRAPGGKQSAVIGEWFFSLLSPLGIPDRAIAYLGDFFGLYVGAFLFEESIGVSSPTGEDMRPEEVAKMLREYIVTLPAEKFPHVIRAADLLFSADRDDRWEFGVDLILRGLETYVQRGKRAR
ncbi:MAG TPA: TetR/AcrR family transcriptional regulator C-terminal domain-containing protein [Acidimicrobiales bacterium]|nr:TetR/AcrR family transcriptional regulator C-terminal domain-containing protein [Acidimicrobiales bacterium]